MKERNWQILSGFVLKVIALVAMTLDHIGFFLMYQSPESSSSYQTGFVFRCIGRIAFPILVMLCAEGVHYTKHPWKYFFRLLAMNLAIQIGETIYFYLIPGTTPRPESGAVHGNAFSDLSLICLTLILLKSKSWRKALSLLPIGFVILCYAIQVYESSEGGRTTVIWLPAYLRPDYSLMGLLFALGFFYAYPLADLFAKPLRNALSLTKEEYRQTNGYRRLVNGTGAFFFFAVTLIFWGISYMGMQGDFRPYDNYGMKIQTYCLITLPLLYLYSGKRGYDSKPMRWITYLYYPVHMGILLLIFWL